MDHKLSYKIATRHAYNMYPDLFDEKFEWTFQTYAKPKADTFIAELPGKSILDIGSGPGNHAVYFQTQGLDVLCGDISQAMVERCKEKGLNARILDIQALPFQGPTFDGIWAYAVILHLPRTDVSQIIAQLALLLKPNGVLGLAVKEGQGEGMEHHTSYPNTERWFTYFQEEEMVTLCQPYFEVISISRTLPKNKFTFLHFLFRRKPELGVNHG